MASNQTLDTIVDQGRYAVSPFTVSVGLVTLALFLWRLSLSGLDPREPPEAVSRIPFIGHIIGMLRYQIQYLEILR
jgi:hypothetical protein